MKKAIFLDRDGTINNNCDHYYIWHKEELLLNPGVIEALAELKSRGYLLIVISNQGGISKGEFSAEDVDMLHVHLLSMLEKEGVKLDDIYYCPHHHLVESCLCRKPQPQYLCEGGKGPGAEHVTTAIYHDVDNRFGLEASFSIHRGE